MIEENRISIKAIELEKMNVLMEIITKSLDFKKIPGRSGVRPGKRECYDQFFQGRIIVD